MKNIFVTKQNFDEKKKVTKNMQWKKTLYILAVDFELVKFYNLGFKNVLAQS